MKILLYPVFAFLALLWLPGCGGGAGSNADETDDMQGPVNTAPQAQACCVQTVALNSLVDLDGSASSDPDGDLLTYHWSFVQVPNSSTSVLNNADSVQPSVLVDTVGLYTVQLIVDDGSASSDAATIQITVELGNVNPVANAGNDRQVTLGETINVDGSQSSDADGDSLLFSWVLSQAPVGSSAGLVNPSAMVVEFTPDVLGRYQLALTVIDPEGGQSTDQTMIDVVEANVAPIANAGSDQAVSTGSTVALDASGSSDSNNDELGYSWAFTSLPSSSLAILDNPGIETPGFTADVAGDYVISLVVNDGELDSAIDTVVVSATAPFLIRNLGVNFGPYDATSNYAGDFIFGCTTTNKVFMEFGAIVFDHLGDPKVLPTFEYIVPDTTLISAIADGEVQNVCWQSTTTDPPDAGLSHCSNLSWDAHDYEITVIVPGNPQYEVYYDHVLNPQVRPGDIIQAGDPIGYPGMTSHACEEFGGVPQLGRTEIMVNSGALGTTYCPFVHFDADTRADFEAQVSGLMADWEQFLFDQYGISGEYDPNTVKAEQVYDEANHVFPGCSTLDFAM